jgi:hypothetical protein
MFIQRAAQGPPPLPSGHLGGELAPLAVVAQLLCNLPGAPIYAFLTLTAAQTISTAAARKAAAQSAIASDVAWA